MSDPTRESPRPWPVIAAEVAQESNPDRLLRLLEELNGALEEQGVVMSEKAEIIWPKTRSKAA